MDLSPLLALLLALGLGAFIGLRQDLTPKTQPRFMGLRTYALVCALGAVSTLFPSSYHLPLAGFLVVTVFMLAAYFFAWHQRGLTGLTTEVTVLLTYLTGVLVGLDSLLLALALAVALAFISGYKQQLSHFTSTLTTTEWNSALLMLLLTGVLLPLLPNYALDPYGLFNPFVVWLLVMVLSGVGFVGYFLTKYLGSRSGIPLTAFLGSLVSSTAVTTHLSSQSKTSPHQNLLLLGLFLAQGVMTLRVATAIFILAPPSQRWSFLVLPLCLAAASALVAAYFWWRSRASSSPVFRAAPSSLRSPLEFRSALTFGLLFVAILGLVQLLQYWFGAQGVYIASFFSSFVDVDAIVISVLQSFSQDVLTFTTASVALSIAVLTNVLVKILYIWVFGAGRFRLPATLGILSICLLGGGTAFLILTA